MMKIEIRNRDDKQIATVIMHQIPRAGDYIRLIRDQPKQSNEAYKVAYVSHTVTDAGIAPDFHHICVFVEEL